MSQDTIELILEPRTVTGKAVKHLRVQGVVPAVIHDHGKDSVLVQGDYVAIMKTYKAAGRHHPVQLKAGGKNFTALIKTIEFEPRKNMINHVVFGAVTANEKVEAEVPIHPRYSEGNEASPAERAGLLVLPSITSVMVEAIPAKLPDLLEYDAERLLEVGDHVTVADLIVPEGVVVITDASQSIVVVNDPTVVAAANDAAGGAAEPEEVAEVESEHGSAEDDKDSQAPEDQPGGKKQFKPKGE